MSDAGHILRFRDRHNKSYHDHAFTLFILLALPVATTSSPYSAATQCGPFSITYGDTTSPSHLLILPFDAQPTFSNLTNAIYDPVTRTWTYTLDKLPLKSGAQFIAALDYGHALSSSGDVSLIQTVGDSPDSSCLTSDALPMSSFFTLSPTVPSECSLQVISWNATRYQGPPFIRGLIPGGEAFDLGYPYPNTTTEEHWTVKMREGTQVVLLVQPAPASQGNGDARTSPLITVTSKSSSTTNCLSIVEIGSTVIVASTTDTSPTSTIIASTSTLPEATKPTKNVSLPAIIGGVTGGLGFIAIVCVAIVLYRLCRRTIDISRPSRSSRELPLAGSPLPIAPTKGVTFSNRQEDQNPPHSVLPDDERQANSIDILAHRPDLAFIYRASSALPDRHNSARRPPEPVTRPSVGVHDEEGGEEVRGEYAFESHSRSSSRLSMDGHSERNRGQPNATGTEYFRQTDAGAVRVVELPPSYNELQF